MIREVVKASKEEVREQALSLLFGKMSKGRSYNTTEVTLFPTYGERTLLDELRGREYQRGEELYSLITDEDTGAKVLYFHVPTTKEGYYRLAYFAPEEWERYTLPFKNLKEEDVYIAVLLNACFIKPVKALSSDEALTPEFANRLNAYFGSDEWTYRTKEEYESKIGTIGAAFQIEDEEIEANPQEWEEEYKENLVFLGYAPVTILTELSGMEIRSEEDYIEAFKRYIKASSLDERQERAIASSVGFELRDLFLKWAIYEFVRTEDYSHLKECLKEYGKFLLPEEWAKGLIYLNVEPEEYVISKYLSKDAISVLQRDQLRQIAKGTNIPFPLILKASKRNIWEF